MHHYVRDVVFGEDASRIGRAHRAMAAVRNTVAGILHLHRVPNIAAQLRACHRDPYQLPAAAPRPHDTAGTERKPRRDLTTPPASRNRAPRPASPEKHCMTSENANTY